MQTTIEEFIKKESSGGILLVIATLLALLLSNTFMSPVYEYFLHIPFEIRVGSLSLDKSLHHWINDGLMSLFFLLIGLEVKREVLRGQLSSVKKVLLPVIAAIGGMAVPAVVYLAFNQHDSLASKGWAIPTATDIAFALGVLSLLGNRAPISLKLFLMTLAIIDDLGAIVIIALFYTNELSVLSITIAFVSLGVLIAMNLLGVAKKAAFFIVGTVLWISLLKSGVHATLAGVALAFTIPMVGKSDQQTVYPLRVVEQGLHYWVAFFILPLFAFANAGVYVTKISLDQMTGGVPLGIMFGLFFGKQLGVFGFSWLAIKLKIAELPNGCTWTHIYGASILTGIGFTMSLFVASLAFEDPLQYQYTEKLAVLIGSFASGIIGYFVLKRIKKPILEIQDKGGEEP